MKKEIGGKITIREYNRLMKNLNIYDNNLNNDQKDWLNFFMNENDYSLKEVVLQMDEGVLWVIINTGNSVKEFSKE